MKKLLLMVMASYALTTSAQMRESEDFVYLANDSVVYANRVTLRPNLSGTLQIRADAKQLSLSKVKFFNNRTGFFANTTGMSIFPGNTFAERVIEGKINVYQSIPEELFFKDRWERAEYARASALSANMYYNKGYGNLKKANYDNLIRDISDNPESVDFLKAYKKKIKTSRTLYIAAGASLVAGMITILTGGGSVNKFSTNFGEANFITGAALSTIGAGLAVGGVYSQLSAQRQLQGAVDAYNR